MRVENVNVLKGPNYWSVNRHRLIVMTLNLEELEELPTNKIEGFYERLQALLPGLVEHRCSEGVRGGFFMRVQEGTWMGHVIEHIALEIQTMAGIETGFGRTRSTDRHGQYHVVFSYETIEAGRYAGLAAVRIAEALIAGKPFALQQAIEEIKELWEDEKLGPSTRAITNEAARRGIPVLRLNDGSYVQLGYGKKQQRIEATITCRTSDIAVDYAGCKVQTKKLLAANYIPVPEGKTIATAEELKEVIEELGYPLVIKPSDGNHGKGVTTKLHSYDGCVAAFYHAKQYSETVIAEQHIEGCDYRVLLVNNKFTAAAKRSPAHVTGDGIHTIEELIKIENEQGMRGNGHSNVLTKIPLDSVTAGNVQEAGFTMDDVLKNGQVVYVRKTANLSTGGTAEDVSATVHPDNIKLFERAARVIGLDICGLDVIAKDLAIPLKGNRSAIIEANAAPGFRMHLAPSIGAPVNVAKPVVDMLFPHNETGRIPIIAITGTNGKTTTTRLIAAMVKNNKKTVGYTTSDGIYIDDELVTTGDCSGPVSAQTVLKDSSVEVAVLETARGGILRSGLGFDACDVAVVTNIAEDHLGLGGIDTIEKLARVKSVVAEAVHSNGYVVLNADDDRVYEMRNVVNCKVALFSLNGSSERIEEHCRQGGIACFADEQYIVLRLGKHQHKCIQKIDLIPLTFNGHAVFNVYNTLAATLAAYAVGCTTDVIKNTLSSFSNNAKDTPGRVNMFTIQNCHVLIDYAHNTHGLQSIGALISSYKQQQKIGIIAGVGDRRDEDIISYSKAAAGIFNVIIIRQDRDTRGRCTDELSHLVKTGIQNSGNPVEIIEIDNEIEALEYAITVFHNNAFIFLAADHIENVLQHMHKLQNSITTGVTEIAHQSHF